jgi:hypothetical protein
MKLLYIALGAVLALLAYVVLTSYQDILRYWNLRKM